MVTAGRSAIEAFLRRAPYLHVYELGDLDPREAALEPRYRAELLGHNLKMGLASPVEGRADDAIVRLTPQHAGEAVQFYAASYPTGYFEPVNLERGPYVAIRDDHGIAAIAGVHVYSQVLRVASLGNIATRPDARGRGHARRATGALCQLLQAEVDVIGLNVRADNAAAIACYRAVGFDVRYAYDEWRVTRS